MSGWASFLHRRCCASFIALKPHWFIKSRQVKDAERLCASDPMRHACQPACLQSESCDEMIAPSDEIECSIVV